MLASITPLGERGRQSTWAVTVTAFVLGARSPARGARRARSAGVGRFVLPGSASVDAEARGARGRARCSRLVLDARPRTGTRSPPAGRTSGGSTATAGWVYGLGFGAQLGIGLTTVVSSAATYVALVAAFLSRDAGGRRADRSAASALVRGFTPLAAARVDRPERAGRLPPRASTRARVSARRAGTPVLGGAARRRGRWEPRCDPRRPRRPARAPARLERAPVRARRRDRRCTPASYPIALDDASTFGDRQHRADAGRRRRSSRLSSTGRVTAASTPGHGLFAPPGFRSPLDPTAFSRSAASRIRGRARSATQHFFTAGGRPFCLYVVLAGGRASSGGRLTAAVELLLRSLRIDAAVQWKTPAS